ncbi:hypothetical protein DEM27_23940 [Metarhizobium album]|uniref:Uncharacterized protein n=1 Tax=Metarhizobium album TaxID=2182425 RepID=A0A2U2DL17_9HYPH|nr:hypothetical protein [Rhizobium album]PWE53961.1 hypothetical protein DEM27_23940 [Rhizobium album]
MDTITSRPSLESTPSLETPLVDEALDAAREQVQPPMDADILALKAEVSRLQESVALITEQSRDLMLRPIRDRPLTALLGVAAFAYILGRVR